MLEISCLSTHSNRRIQIKRQFPSSCNTTTAAPGAAAARFGFDESVEAGDVFEFGVGVEEEGCVV
jgi:hypothetical protein